MLHIADNGFIVDMCGADETDDIYGYSVSLQDAAGEIVSWSASEWIESPDVVAYIVDAIMIGIVDGPDALRDYLGV